MGLNQFADVAQSHFAVPTLRPLARPTLLPQRS
jgi:hypothetical protein